VNCSGRRSKQRIQGQHIIFEGKGPKRGGIRIYCDCDLTVSFETTD